MRAYEDIPIEEIDDNSLNTAQLKVVNETIEDDFNDKPNLSFTGTQLQKDLIRIS